MTPSESAAADLRATLGDDSPSTILTPESRLFAFSNSILDKSLSKTCVYALPAFRNLFKWPASLSHHHAYETGLIQHTLEVTELALHMAEKFPKVNRDVLVAAALWHDLSKTSEYCRSESVFTEEGLALAMREKQLVEIYEDYDRMVVWAKTPFASTIGHISASAIEFTIAARANEVDAGIIAEVVHCILAHHGPVRDWGSPVAPQSLEAWLLHQADMLSASYGATK